MVSHGYSSAFCDWVKNCLVALVELKIQLSAISISIQWRSIGHWIVIIFIFYGSRISMLDCLFMEIRQSPGLLQLGLHLLMGMQSLLEFLWFCVYILIKWKETVENSCFANRALLDFMSLVYFLYYLFSCESILYQWMSYCLMQIRSCKCCNSPDQSAEDHLLGGLWFENNSVYDILFIAK